MSALVETMAYAGEVPWHGLGTKVPHDLSTDDMLKQSGLDWSVEKVPTLVYLPISPDKSGGYQPTGSFALIRSSDNKVLAPSVGQNWNPVQNKEAFDIVLKMAKDRDMTGYEWPEAEVKREREAIETVEAYLDYNENIRED